MMAASPGEGKEARDQRLYLTRDLIRKAEREITGCQECDPRADTPFYWILDATVGAAGSAYVIPFDATCPVCGSPVGDQTRVKWS